MQQYVVEKSTKNLNNIYIKSQSPVRIQLKTLRDINPLHCEGPERSMQLGRHCQHQHPGWATGHTNDPHPLKLGWIHISERDHNCRKPNLT